MHATSARMTVLCAAFLLAGLGTASAQDLDGTWLKARVVARLFAPKTTEVGGMSPNPLTQKPAKRVVKKTVYLSLRGTPGNGSGDGDMYFVDVWTEIGGELVMHSSGSLLLTPKGVVKDLSFSYPADSEGGEIVVFASARARAKTDADGELKRLRLRTFGGRSTGLIAGEVLHGSARVRARSVPASSLPPIPDA